MLKVLLEQIAVQFRKMGVDVGHFLQERGSRAEEVVDVPIPRSREQSAVLKVILQERFSRVEEIGELAPWLSEQVVVPLELVPERVVEQIADVTVPVVMKEVAEVAAGARLEQRFRIQLIPQARVSECVVVQIVDVTVPPVVGSLCGFSAIVAEAGGFVLVLGTRDPASPSGFQRWNLFLLFGRVMGVPSGSRPVSEEVVSTGPYTASMPRTKKVLQW